MREIAGTPKRAVTFTTAPPSYDWLFTRELDPHVGLTLAGEVVRVVETGSLWPHQRRRYELAGFWAKDEDGWLELVGAKGAFLKPWHEDEAFVAWLSRRSLLGLDAAVKELMFAAFQGGRLMAPL